MLIFCWIKWIILHFNFQCILLTINIIECKRSWNRPVAIPMCWSVYRSVCRVYCGKTADWIQMLFVVVSGVGGGMFVLDRVHVPREVLGFSPIGFSGIFLTNVFNSCMENWIFLYGQYIIGIVSLLVFRKYCHVSRVNLGLREICQKYNSYFMKRIIPSSNCEARLTSPWRQ